MKGVGFWMSAVCAMLLLASFAVATDMSTQSDSITATSMQSTRASGMSSTPNAQRILDDEYRNWFFEMPRPQAQRILNVDGLKVRHNDLGTPAVLGAERVLDPDIAWRFGYDTNTGMPLLSPRGEKRVLKYDLGYGEASMTDLTAPPTRERVLGFREDRVMRMAQYIANKRKYPQYMRARARVPVQLMQSLEDLDARPIFLSEYERLQGFRDINPTSVRRGRFLMSQPGVVFSELEPMVGSGQMQGYDIARIAFLTRSVNPIQGDASGSGRSKQGTPYDSEMFMKARFQKSAPGMIYYGGR